MDKTLPQPSRSRPRAIIRILLLVLMSLLGFIPIFTCWVLKLERTRSYLVRRFFSGAATIVGLRVHVTGQLDPARPLLLISNHASYLDVFAIGGFAPISFTPKREVRSWPIIGFFCVLADCVFVERRPSHMQEARRKMRKRLNKDKILCLFPEGTTSDNVSMKPFKSGFFSLAEVEEEGEEPLPVQPMTLAYTRIGKTKMLPHWFEQVAWIGDDTFFDHFWRVLKLPSITAEIEFHEAHVLAPGESRKELSQECRRVIGEALTRIHEQTV